MSFWRRSATNPIGQIREHFTALGSPIDQFTDAEIEQGALRFVDAVRRFGLTKDEAYERLRGLSASTGGSKGVEN